MGRMIQLSHHSSACLAYFHREHSDNHRCLRLVSHHLSIIFMYSVVVVPYSYVSCHAKLTSQCYQYGVCMITDSIVVMIIIEEELEEVW